jgi:hypothetical protein
MPAVLVSDSGRAGIVSKLRDDVQSWLANERATGAPKVTVVVECRHCGNTFELDVLAISGSWWNRCPSKLNLPQSM